MVGWSRRNNVITTPDFCDVAAYVTHKKKSSWTFICWKKTFLICDHWNHTLTFTLHVGEWQCVYARARIAFVLKLYYLSTIFCQQQHMFAGRRHLTYPAWRACPRISSVGYVWWRPFGGFKKAVIYPVHVYIRQWLRHPIGLYCDVWIAAIASSRTSLAILTVVMCNTSQCKLRSLRVNSGMVNVICIVT